MTDLREKAKEIVGAHFYHEDATIENIYSFDKLIQKEKL